MVARRVRNGCGVWVVWLAWLPLCWAQSVSSGGAEGRLISPARMPGSSVDEHTTPANVTVITAEEIQQSRVSTVQEAIARAEGVVFSDQQGFGLASDSTVNLRGVVNSSRTGALVLVDGVRQNRLTGDEVHWQSIPVNDVERIEIIRGGGGLIYGEGALSGVINIITKRAGERPFEAEAGSEGGSYGWQQHYVSAQGRAAPFTYGVSSTRRMVGGYRDYSGARATNVRVHAGVEFAPLARGTVGVSHSDDTTEFPGGLTPTQARIARRTAGSFHGFITNEVDQVSTDLVLGPWAGVSTALNWFWRRWTTHSVDSSPGKPFSTSPSRGLSIRTTSELTSDALSNLLASGLELSDDKAKTGNTYEATPPDNESNRRGYGLYLEDTLTVRDRLSLVGGLRFDRFDYDEAISFPTFTGALRFKGFSPKAGVTYGLIPKTWDLFASYSRPFKAPNVDDFAAQVANFASNIHLKPQQATAYEIGTRYRKAPLTAKATWFHTRTSKEILFNMPAGQNQNFDTQRTGLETAVRLDVPETLRGYLTYTFVASEFRKGAFAGNEIPGTPAHTLTAGLGIAPVKSCWVDLDWRVVKDYHRINDMNNALEKGDDYGVLDLTVQYELPRRWAARELPSLTAYLKIRNISNARYVTFHSSNASDLMIGAGDYPMPPITFTGGVTTKF